MSAINVCRLTRHKQILLAVDGAYYLKDGQILGFGPKMFPVCRWPGVVAMRGDIMAVSIIGQLLAFRFNDFDAVVDGIEDELPAMVGTYRQYLEKDPEQDTDIDIVIAGWSSSRERSESYFIPTHSKIPGITKQEAEQLLAKSGGILPEEYKLKELPNSVTTPALPYDHCERYGFPGLNKELDPEPATLRLQYCLELQRRNLQTHDERMSSVVGGYAELAVITPGGVDQKILCRWPEDLEKVGDYFAPPPLEGWETWRDERMIAAAPEGISRLQRERFEKRQRKLARRA